MKTIRTHVAVLGALAIVVGCASTPAVDPVALIKGSFRDEGIAKLDRLDQDAVQRICSAEQRPSADVAKRLEAEALATIKWPDGGQYFGDWVAGEKLAQSGRGMSWNEKSTDPKGNGGNCYNCHQIDNKEISYGTIGPSLWNYGKLRGVKNVTDPSAHDVVQFTWSKLWNSHSHGACSLMPRFGHKGLLNQDQIRDLMSLLLDPRSPVNQ